MLIRLRILLILLLSTCSFSQASEQKEVSLKSLLDFQFQNQEQKSLISNQVVDQSQQLAPNHSLWLTDITSSLEFQNDITESFTGQQDNITNSRPFETRVQAATKAILTKSKWTDPQKTWLRRIAEQITKEIVVDRDSIDQGTFAAQGGFNRLNRVFNGKLENILHDFNEELWKVSA